MSIVFSTDVGGMVNFSNGNASAVLGALGLGSELWGKADLPTARRAIIRALNRDLSRFTRAEVSTPLFYSGGINSEGIELRIRELSSMIEAMAKRGATEVYWS